MDRKPNRLISEKSPYLRQHACNPVDWHTWGHEAFEKAEREGKPIFLSIGYSTCHWCHVMARESFGDPEVAGLMNQAFVSIKVDREERPDIDSIYMSVCQLMTGSGGWPLTLFLTPDKKPFFAGTYFPKQARFGQIGMLELIPRIQKAWAERRDDVLSSADQIAASLSQELGGAPGKALGEAVLQDAYQQLARRFDHDQGGFGNAPKFPTPHNLLFLLRSWKRSREEKTLAMVEQTLQAMRRGGIYDQIGFGFHRYSTDARWLVPHFEKMLYDQALLAMTYTEAFQATGKEEYRRTAQEILAYVLRDMTSPEGGFYSAEDADSEGDEGKFYVWSEPEIQQALPQEDIQLLIRIYNIEKGGNFSEQSTGRETRSNILHLTRPLSETAAELKMPEEELCQRLEKARERLFAAREQRVHPGKDDKVLVDWNGLMIAALARAAAAFSEPRYARAAEKAAEFILKRMRRADGRLLHRFRDGEAAVQALADDYVFLTWGLIELYEATFEPRHLGAAMDLNQELLLHFWDDKNGGFFFTAEDGERLLFRQKEVYDGAIPSANSVAFLNLLRLGRMTGEAELEAKAAQMSRAFAGPVTASPAAHTFFLAALDFTLGPLHEVVIAGDPEAPDTQAMLQELRKRFLPGVVLLLRPISQDRPKIVTLAPFTKDLAGLNGRATAYVCANHACHLPTTDIGKMLELLAIPRP